VSLIVKTLNAEEWKELSKEAHEICFNEKWEPTMERIDFALLFVNEENVPVAYATAQEKSKEHVYLQYGGAFPGAKGTFISFKAFYTMLEVLKARYKTITTLVENTNWGMLKYYLSAQFRITGIRYFKNSTYLENTYHVPRGTT
jgi:ribosomal protein S18 acetylase RimI-like enzyme